MKGNTSFYTWLNFVVSAPTLSQLMFESSTSSVPDLSIQYIVLLLQLSKWIQHFCYVLIPMTRTRAAFNTLNSHLYKWCRSVSDSSARVPGIQQAKMVGRNRLESLLIIIIKILPLLANTPSCHFVSLQCASSLGIKDVHIFLQIHIQKSPW